jgi:hypothetical protein
MLLLVVSCVVFFCPTPKEKGCDSCPLPTPLHCRFLESFDEKSKRKKDGSCHMTHAKRSWGLYSSKEMLAFFYSRVWIFPYGKNPWCHFCHWIANCCHYFIYVEQPLEYKLVTCLCPRALPGAKRDLVKERNFSKAKIAPSENEFLPPLV